VSRSNFNFIAPFYDLLARIFFGRSLQITQQFHLSKIGSEDKVLILGGGTGQVLRWLPDCDVTYLELSTAMIARAKKRGQAQFIQADFLTHSLDQKFDWIVCPFFLDCFDVENLNKVLLKIHSHLNNSGQLMVTDFQNNGRWVFRTKLATMLLFFRMAASLKTKELLRIDQCIKERGFKRTESQLFSRGSVFSSIFTPTNS